MDLAIRRNRRDGERGTGPRGERAGGRSAAPARVAKRPAPRSGRALGRLLIAIVVAGIGSAGCGSGDGDAGSSPVSRCEQVAPSISQGIAGCTTTQDDTGLSTGPKVYARMEIRLYPEAAVQPPNGSDPLATVRSDDIGHFEIGADPGRYWLCTSFLRCTTVGVGEGQVLRRDYEFSVGPGWSAGRLSANQTAGSRRAGLLAKVSLR